MGAKFFRLPLLLMHPAKRMRKQLIIRIPLKKNILVIRSFFLLLLSCIAVKTNLCFPSTSSSNGLGTLSLEGHLTFDEVQHAARDFGNRYQFLPLAVLHPTSVSDIAVTVKHIFQKGASSELTVAARGHGHSLQGQSQAHGGVVVNMESLKNPTMKIHLAGKFPYVDVSGGELWINILQESLKYGLAPKSWTDYLHLTVGGTLMNHWRSSFSPQDPVQASQFTSDGKTLFCLEVAKYYDYDEIDDVAKEVEMLLSQLSYISSTLFFSEVPYIEFLDRVHVSEIKLRSKRIWEVPHPWLNLLIPKSTITTFAAEVFASIFMNPGRDQWTDQIILMQVGQSDFCCYSRRRYLLPGGSAFLRSSFFHRKQ